MLMAQMQIEIVVNKQLPRHPEFDSATIARKFWQLTFETGRDYVYGRDAHGGPVLVPHEREKEGYQRRKQITKPRNHAGPIVRRYNNHVFRIPATRNEDSAPDGSLYRMLLDDADGHGNPLSHFMSKSLQEAQIDRDSYILCDSTKPEGYEGDMSVAQAKEAKVRPVLRMIDADSVIHWREYDGAMTEAIVIFEREDGSRFARQYDDENYRDIELKKPEVAPAPSAGEPQYGYHKAVIVESIGEESPHGYGDLPLIRMRPFDGEPQIGPMAESQQNITNLLSLLMEEIYNVTFSQMILTGVAASDVKGEFIGNNRVICVPNPAGGMMAIGADPAQAKTIQDAIINEQKELYRIAGISADDQSKQPESGIAKAFKHNDLSANLAALAESVQNAENRAMRLIFEASGQKYPGNCKYPDDFDLPNIADDMTDLASALTLQSLPPMIKQKMVTSFAQEHLSLDEDEKRQLETELQDIGKDPLQIPMRTPGT